jgi:hypothetical protein
VVLDGGHRPRPGAVGRDLCPTGRHVPGLIPDGRATPTGFERVR